MDPLSIFGLQLIMSLFAYSLLARWYVGPWLNRKPKTQALSLLVFPHTLRHLGLVFLVPGIPTQTLPGFFANPVAFGDLASAVLAILSVIALRRQWRGALALVWVFNIVGTVDLVNALRHAEAVPLLGAAWYIPTYTGYWDVKIEETLRL